MQTEEAVVFPRSASVRMEQERLVAAMEDLQRYDIHSFDRDDFETDERSCIWNKKFYEGCTFLFIVWHTPTRPVLVYNEKHVEGLVYEDRKREWIEIWGSLFIQRTPENEDWQSRPAWDEAIKKMDPHLWMFDLGRY